MNLLTQEEFDEARREFREGRLTDRLWEFLYVLVRQLSQRRLLAKSLSPTGKWDRDAADEVAQGWLTDQLAMGGLTKAFDRVNDPRSLSRYLERSLRNWLISEARKKATPRLLQRTRDLLLSDETFVVAVSATSPWSEWWGLSAWSDATPYTDTDSALAALAWRLGDFSILRYRSDAGRSDPILSSDDLGRFVIGLFEEVEHLLTLRHLSAVFERRFAFAYSADEIPMDTLSVEVAGRQPAEVDVEAGALRVLGSLDNRELQVIALRYGDGLTLEATAERLKVSKSTVHNDERRALRTIRDHVVDETEASFLVEKLLAMAFQERDQ